MSRYQILGLQGAKPFRKHTIGDIGNGRFDQSVPGPTAKEKLENSPGPTAADELDGTMEAGTDLVGWSVGHGLKGYEISRLTQVTYFNILGDEK